MSDIQMIFSTTEIAEIEYFQEYNKYNKPNPWILLIYILKSFAFFCMALQLSLIEYPFSVDYFLQDPSFNYSANLFYSVDCENRQKQMFYWMSKNCDKENLLIEMNLWKNMGVSLGGIIAGLLGDLFGRRLICFIFSILWLIFSVVLINMNTVLTFEIVFMHASICCTVVNIVSYVNFGEIINKKYRIMTVYYFFFYTIGVLMLHVTSMYLKNWRYQMMFTSATLLLVIFGSWYVPESPRWLLNWFRKKEAYQILSEISGKKFDFNEEEMEGFLYKTMKVKMIFIFLFCTRAKEFLICAILIIVANVFSSFGRWCGTLKFIKSKESAWITFLVEGLSFVIILPFYFFLDVRYGLSSIFILLMLGSAVTLVFFDQNALIYFAVFISVLGLTSLLFVWLYIFEIFPTLVRSTMIGLMFFFWGLTDIFSIILTDLVIDVQTSNNVSYFYLVFTGISVLGLSAMFLLPTMMTGGI